MFESFQTGPTTYPTTFGMMFESFQTGLLILGIKIIECLITRAVRIITCEKLTEIQKPWLERNCRSVEILLEGQGRACHTEDYVPTFA